jgi:hypothetical protein
MSALGDQVFLVLAERLQELVGQEALGFPVAPELEAVRGLLQKRLRVHRQSLAAPKRRGKARPSLDDFIENPDKWGNT